MIKEWCNYRRAKKGEGTCIGCVNSSGMGDHPDLIDKSKVKYYCTLPVPNPRVSKIKLCDEWSDDYS